MKTKILNFLLIVTSLIGYLEWGGNNHTFLFMAEAELFDQLLTNPVSTFHPFTLIPLAGQLVLVFTLFQKRPSKTLTYISIAGLGLLLGFMFAIGLMSFNFRILISTIPFLVVAVLTVLHFKKLNKHFIKNRTSNHG